MYKAIVFAGTTEGYALCEFLAENRVSVYACAAPEYEYTVHGSDAT